MGSLRGAVNVLAAHLGTMVNALLGGASEASIPPGQAFEKFGRVPQFD
jgi:hypothetical protein